MPSGRAIEVSRLMHLVEVRLRDAGIESSIEDGSLCAFRPVYDKPTATTYGMSSAIHVMQRGSCFRRLYCTEQHNEAGELVKFSASLTDEKKVALGEWHKDFSHGLHTHPVVNGVREKAHVPFAGNISDMATEIVAAMGSGLENGI
jgi:hypothetical protein